MAGTIACRLMTEPEDVVVTGALIGVGDAYHFFDFQADFADETAG